MNEWVRVKPFTGGQLVHCALCGKRAKRVFKAADSNYAEAFRGAVAWASMHEKSEAHTTALGIFHAPEAPPPWSDEVKLAKIFGTPVPSERERRMRAARGAVRTLRMT